MSPANETKVTAEFKSQVVLLHSTLAYRIYGSLTGDLIVRQRSGLLNAIAILLFLAVTALTVFRSNLERKVSEPQPAKVAS